jgi:hypothetical protein
MKLSLSKEAREARKRKIIHVAPAKEKQDEVIALTSNFSLELSEAKSEILKLKQEIIDQQIKISKNFKAMKETEIRALKGLFEEEKRSLIYRMSQEHSQQIVKINRENEKKVRDAVLQSITEYKEALKRSMNQVTDLSTGKPTIQNRHYKTYNSDENLMELDRQYDRDNGFLDPAPYYPEYE